ncbi:hypothetical protein PanWU01x14_328980 [Parasponia andersonii]|uniref:Uncharacterized protein n=1 Tax=Parasponia andersonii TaxID=3476 RepID=A0A2P5AIN0_PARAD|nr:hypothetical protein PanWU01x14_328980 [Parasponia andersonii]
MLSDADWGSGLAFLASGKARCGWIHPNCGEIRCLLASFHSRTHVAQWWGELPTPHHLLERRLRTRCSGNEVGSGGMLLGDLIGR